MGTNYAPLLADLFLHPFECNFMINTMKQDMTKALSDTQTIYSALTMRSLEITSILRVWTSKLDFAKRLRRLSSRLNQQGFKSALLVRPFNKFFKCHGAIVEKYNTTLQEMRRQSMVEWLLI